MSRSRRKNLVFPICCNGGTQKPWKQQINRIFRRKSKVQLETSLDENGEVLKDYFYRNRNKRKFADIWLSPSDGTQRIKMMTKDEFEIYQNRALPYYFSSARRNPQTYKQYINNFKRTLISK